MTGTLLAGVAARRVPTDRLSANVLERPSSGEAQATVLFVHGNVSSSLFWQPLMLALPHTVRALAVDLRGFGDSETLPVDATRGVRDFSDDVAAVADALGTGPVHLVGWSMGGGVAMQLLLDRPDLVRTLTLVSTVSPYGFGGTGADGGLLNADASGTGGGGANPDFVARLRAGDTGEESPTSPRAVYRSSYVAPGFQSDFEDLWVESMLSTATGEDNYPGDASATEHWPGFGPGTRGVLNTMAPTYFDTSGIVDLAEKPPVLWIHGELDAIVGDASYFDLNQLGAAGIVPGWPGEEVAPPQPVLAQTRAVLDRYGAAGGSSREVVFDDCGHSPHIEKPDEFLAELLAHLG
ncbi:alpha/beta hydrolase [Leifsonia sp. ZF2019]|uniref:alpha/beta fold hydrolase n=1 Tax=Leifsonia sp. ZF2019 TaxID=2781978 RepID=UPI001CBD9FD9|nr:alpha/beta hydrolase [Leifsonia sp. ZF2019]UAJ79039.1 alpha/beta hydrolase [Leifsonia sp. ZF2019]